MSFSENDIKLAEKFLKNSRRRFWERKIKTEEAGRYIRCYQTNAENTDLIGVIVEEATVLRCTFQGLIYYSAEEIQDKVLLSKIATCKGGFGYGRLNVFEYIGKSSKNPRETPLSLRP